MRLDHLLSKENIVIVCFVAGWVLVSAWLVASFSLLFCVWFRREVVAVFVFRWNKSRAWFLRVWGISETKMSVFVFWFVLFVWHAVGCLEQHGCCSIESPLLMSKICLVIPYFGFRLGGCCLLGWCVV